MSVQVTPAPCSLGSASTSTLRIPLLKHKDRFGSAHSLCKANLTRLRSVLEPGTENTKMRSGSSHRPAAPAEEGAANYRHLQLETSFSSNCRSA